MCEHVHVREGGGGEGGGERERTVICMALCGHHCSVMCLVYNER